MKKIILIIISVLLCNYTFAQDTSLGLESEDSPQPLISLNKGKYFKDVNMIANMRFASNTNFTNSNFDNSKFQMNEFRLEISGKITDKISFTFRDRYANNSTDANTTDRLNHSIDLAHATFAITPDFSLTAGKMLSEWGSYELFINPVYMYTYNDMVQYGDFFLSGIKASWTAVPHQNFTLQIVNSNTRSFEMRYGETPGIEAARAPLGGTVNWKGDFADEKFSTMWSYSIYNLAKNQHWNLLALGNQLKLPNLTLQYDFKYSTEDLDNTGVISDILGYNFAHRAQDVKYMEHWVRAEYFFAPRWSTTIMGMTNSNYWDGNPDANADDHIRTQWGFTAALEYHIYKPYNVKLFAAYVGRYNNFSDYARNTLNLSNNNTGQLLIGIVSPLVLF
ncbi:phosphate-selective porin O/P [Dysgonomonas alginatilytica]|uniref:Phosphate-selective porin O/P n=1 Tax=Dysgonomonas alginatilytica TaxID=1605892 RepID=A0A2V3PTA1_9BACT|nr:porin [Dysgonomonas alginatilytica]PXV66312.1 phosphate-selective porin O/P [Dysgonomonas alginatilytica]